MSYLYFSLCFYITYPYFSLFSTTSILRIITSRGKLQCLNTHVDFTDCTCRFCFSIQNGKDRLHQRPRRWKYYKEWKIRLLKNSIYLAGYFWLGFRSGLDSNAGDLGWIAGLGRSPGERNVNPLQYSCRRIPWSEEPGSQSMGSQRVGHNRATDTYTFLATLGLRCCAGFL